MKRILRTVLLAAGLSAALTGCLQSKTVMTVRKDGSGTIEHTGYMAKMDFPDAKQEKTDAQLAEQYAAVARDLGVGVTVKSITPLKDRPGYTGGRVVYAFSDVSQLAVEITPGMGDNIPENGMHFEFTKGPKSKLTVIMPSMKNMNFGREDKDQKPTPEQEKAQDTMMAQLVKDMLIDFELRVDGTISETNAAGLNTAKDGIVLIHEDIGSLFKDDAAVKAFKAMNVINDAKELKEKLKEPVLKKYIQIEPSEKVSIEFN